MHIRKIILLSSLVNSSVALAADYQTSALKNAEASLANVSAGVRKVMESAPSVYSFTSSFDGKESSFYTGQTFRQVLINDYKSFIGSQNLGTYPGDTVDALEALNSYYNYDYQNNSFAEGSINGIAFFQGTSTSINGESLPYLEGEVYDDIQFQGKQLQNKTAGNDNALRHGKLLGWDTLQLEGVNLATIDADGKGDGFVEPEDLIQMWNKIVAERMTEGRIYTVLNGNLPPQRILKSYVLENGIDLSQLLQKFILGAVNFSQVAGDYLATDLSSKKGLNASDTDLYGPGTNYTVLEHHWDEAFGYFGAARNYLAYNDEQLSKKLDIDINQDGMISLLDEKNYSYAINTGRFDFTSVSPKTTFSEDIMNSFLQGRHLISKKPAGYKDTLKALSVKAIATWEKVIAATVIHYINRTINELDSYGTEEYLFTDLAKFWSEMKGFALGFQFNPESMLTKDGFIKVHQLMGDAPALPHNSTETELKAYKANLLNARQILQDVFEFSDTNTQTW